MYTFLDGMIFIFLYQEYICEYETILTCPSPHLCMNCVSKPRQQVKLFYWSKITYRHRVIWKTIQSDIWWSMQLLLNLNDRKWKRTFAVWPPKVPSKAPYQYHYSWTLERLAAIMEGKYVCWCLLLIYFVLMKYSMFFGN